MKRSHAIIVLLLIVGLAAYFAAGRGNGPAVAAPADAPHSAASAASAASATDGGQRQAEELQKQVKALQGLVPDQAAVMTHVGYHFSNLWFAIDQENWPLADFYLGEAKNNIDWAVRAKPIRKDAEGRVIDLAAIAQAVENTQFAELKKAITARQKEQCVKLYDQTLEACYGCHKASSKPYLRPQRPSRPEVPIINFDPKATWPQ